MNRFQRFANLIGYEWRRAFAKKKFFVLVILTVALQILVFVSFNFIFSDPPAGFDIENVKATMWLVGILGPQELFMPLIAIVIAGGSMSEEYEHGSADLLLSKPVTKIDYMTGKYLGGFTLSSFIIALTTILGVVLAFGFFGPQKSLLSVLPLYLALVYANFLFFSLSFMFSEAFRRTTLAILATIGIFVASILIGSYLGIISGITQEQFYLNIIRWLPNWSVSNFPSFVVSKFMTIEENPFVSLPGENYINLSAAIIAAYTVVCIILAVVRLVRSDVTKKT